MTILYWKSTFKDEEGKYFLETSFDTIKEEEEGFDEDDMVFLGVVVIENLKVGEKLSKDWQDWLQHAFVWELHKKKWHYWYELREGRAHLQPEDYFFISQLTPELGVLVRDREVDPEALL